MAWPAPLKPAVCGTRSKYNGGCRCEPCRKAQAEYQSQLRARRPEARLRKNLPANRLTRLRAKEKLWQERNRELVTETARQWYLRNRETALPKAKARLKSWRKANPNEYRAQNQARADRVRRAAGTATAEALAQRVAYYGDCCAYCGGPFEHLDHVIPIVRGGTNWPANLRPACADCNLSKGAKTLEAWRAT